MTKQNEKPRQFWIYQDDSELLSVCRYKLDIQEQEFHVIEYSAYEQLKQENERLKKYLELARNENA